MRTIPTLLLALAAAAASAAPPTVLGNWRISGTDDGTSSRSISVVRTPDGYLATFDGGESGLFQGSDRVISYQYTMSERSLREELSDAPDAVIRQALGQVYKRFTLTVSNDGSVLTQAVNITNVEWSGDQLTRIDPNSRISYTTYARIGGPPAPRAIRIGALETNVFTCNLVDPRTSGCLEVRNDSERRVRLRFDGTPGVACTADPHVWCGVALEVGEYAIRLVPDDDQGVGPELAGRITVSTTGTRIRIVGD